MKNMIENILKAEIDESDSGELKLNIPRDKKSEFEPQIVKKLKELYQKTKQI